MLTKPVLTLAEANSLVVAALAEAQANEWLVSVAVVDDGGHALAVQRLDGAAPITAYIAPQKARTSALGRRESRDYEAMINNGRTAFLSVPEISATLEGGVPIWYSGHLVGAIGVSGVKPEQDTQIAQAGLAALTG